MLAAMVLASCTTAPAPPQLQAGKRPVEANGPSLTIALTAEKNAFDKKTITVPAGAVVTVVFSNNDSVVSHNFAIYETPTSPQAIYKGEFVTPGKNIEYTFIAPSKAGTHVFECDAHSKEMHGDFVVTAAQ